MTGVATSRVAPFGHLGITACVPLPRAYRSLPRPSSPPCAQASPTCLRSLDYVILTSTKQSTRIDQCNLVHQSPRDGHAATRDSMRIHIPRSTSSFAFQTAATSPGALAGRRVNLVVPYPLARPRCRHATTRFREGEYVISSGVRNQG